MKRIGAVTVGRSDFGIYLPVLEAIETADDLELCLIVSGAHLDSRFGNTIGEIRRHDFKIAEEVDMLLASDTPRSIGKSMGMGLIGFTDAYDRANLDLLLVLGDRYEMHCAATAAVPLGIPVAHLHGGERTEGAIDELFRHSITKLSHLHFVATEEYGKRVIQLGEAPWRVTVSGAPALDRVGGLPLLDRDQFDSQFGIPLRSPTVAVTFHPVTLERDDTRRQMTNLLEALHPIPCQYVFTYPNADAGNQLIVEMLNEFARNRDNASVVVNLGPRGYFSLMEHASAMVGNSSSGIIEAASFHLPVVNIGTRQQGRLRPANVRDVGYSAHEIEAAVREALTEKRRNEVREIENPYGDGHAAQRIVRAIRNAPRGDKLLRKQFYDVGSSAELTARDTLLEIGVDA